MIRTYNDMSIEVIQSTPNPNQMLRLACDITMRQKLGLGECQSPTQMAQLIKFLLDAEHGNPLEHIIFTFLVKHTSRSFMAQATRHRIGTFTLSSQHYQDYRGYPYIIHPEYVEEFERPMDDDNKLNVFDQLTVMYEAMIDRLGIPKEEARQILPNAAGTNLLWTVNASSLVNFLRKRCCNRNLTEMRIFANRIHNLVSHLWPEYTQWLGPQCYMDRCKQGKMQCKEGGWDDDVTI